MIDRNTANYVDYKVYGVTRIKSGYGYRVVLIYADGTKKIKQKSGFSTKREAQAAREKTIAELYCGEYTVFSSVLVEDYMYYWLDEDVKSRTDSNDTYYTFKSVIKNHIVPEIGKKRMEDVSAGEVRKLYNKKAEYSVSVTRLIKVVMNLAFRFALDNKVISHDPTVGVRLPKHLEEQKPYHTRIIDKARTLTLDQMLLLLEKSRETRIHMQLCFNMLMGLRRGEINGVKYADVDFVTRTLSVERQLGKILDANKEDFPPKTLTKQEIDVKTESSHRVLPIPDYVFEAILEQRKIYERNRRRRSTTFQDMDYICCSSYGRPRSKNYHWKHYKKLLQECGLPDIRWHDLRTTFCTLLLTNDFSPKAVATLMGHSKEIVTVDVYGDKQRLIADCVPEIDEFLKEILPTEDNKQEYIDSDDSYLPDFSDILPGSAKSG